MNSSSQKCVKAFLCDDHGAVAIEYTFIAGAMFLAIIAAFPQISTAVKNKLVSVGGYFATIQ